METNEGTRPGAEMKPEQLQSDMDTIKDVLSKADRDRSIHRIIVAVGNFVFGIFGLMAGPFMLLGVSTYGEVAGNSGESASMKIVGGMFMAAIAATIVLAFLFLLAGWGVLKKKRWGATLAFIAGILNLLNVPLGTGFGIYTFWVVAKGKLS